MNQEDTLEKSSLSLKILNVEDDSSITIQNQPSK